MNPRLLVAADDTAFWATHQGALAESFSVERATDSKSALAALQAGAFQAVLISVEMGPDQGYRLCAAIRKEEACRGLRVALISTRATNDEFSRHRTLRGRADAYLHAPIQPAALVGAIQDMLKAPALQNSQTGTQASSLWKRIFG